MKSCGIGLCLTYSAQCPLDSSTLLQMGRVYPLRWLSNIPLYTCATAWFGSVLMVTTPGTGPAEKGDTGPSLWAAVTSIATRWQACPFRTEGSSGCWELRLADEFVYSSFIHSWFLFPKHFGLLMCASRHCAGCEEETKVALPTTLYSAAGRRPRPGSVTADRCLWGRPAAWACSDCSHVGWCPLSSVLEREPGLDLLPFRLRLPTAGHKCSCIVVPGAEVFSMSVAPPNRPNLKPPAPRPHPPPCHFSFPFILATWSQK